MPQWFQQHAELRPSISCAPVGRTCIYVDKCGIREVLQLNVLQFVKSPNYQFITLHLLLGTDLRCNARVKVAVYGFHGPPY